MKYLKENGIIDTFDEIYELAEYEKEEYGQVKSVRYLIPKEYLWDNMLKITKGLGEKLTEALRVVARENPELQGVIDIVDYNISKGGERIISDEVLTKVLQIINKLKLGLNDVEPDILGRAYEYLIRQFAEESGKKAGEFYTPRAIIKLLVNILDPQEGETIYDPACGTGGMLLEAIHHVKEAEGNVRTLWGKLFGQEKNLTTSAIARMNLFLHGVEDFNIVRGDTLRNPGFYTGDSLASFDCVIANPPFSLKNWGDDAWQNDPYGRNFAGVPPAKSGDYAWVQHMISSLAPKSGRMAVVLPHGVLFRMAKEGKIRRDKDGIQAIAELLANFLSHKAEGVGTPRELYKRPRNLFVATFLGRCTLIKGKISKVLPNSYVTLVSEEGDLKLVGIIPSEELEVKEGEEAVAIMRPQDFSPEEPSKPSNVIEGIVDWLSFVGPYVEIRVNRNGKRILINVPTDFEVEVNKRFKAFIPYDATIIFPSTYG